jgi:sarcosine oxidase
MPEAFQAWRDLEADAAEPLYIRTGGVTFGPPGVDYVAQVAASLADLGVPHRRMNGRALNRAIRAFGVPDDTDVVFEPDAGLIAAAKAVAIEVALAQRHGGDTFRLLEQTPVRRIDLDGERPKLVIDSGEIVAERLIVSSGAWVSGLLPELAVPLRATRQQVLYFRPADPAPFRIGEFPVFIFKGAGELDAFYGMPSFRGLGVKVAHHCGPETDPDRPDPNVDDAYRERVRAFLAGSLPALAVAPIDLTEVCLYTVAPGENFLVDFLPGRSDVIVASPCSGHGFKFSCLVGRVLADLATNGQTDLDISAWRMPATS